ncbi:DctA-YdbH Dicarboxylate transport [Salmonella enterica subsp. enterica]|nr:DctA-YdbH Dicarboxylate transport [Salmonella enterica subsp. enterica]
MRRWLFSAAQGQGFEAGGHGVLKGGSAWMPDNKINGVDFILPFRFHNGAWQLGTRGPVSLRIAGIVNQVTAKNITAGFTGRLSLERVESITAKRCQRRRAGRSIIMKQLRMPQHDPALLRVAKYFIQRID